MTGFLLIVAFIMMVGMATLFLRADFEEVIRYNTEQLKRFWLLPFKRKQFRDEISHAQFMLRYIEEQSRHLKRSRLGAAGVDGHASL